MGSCHPITVTVDKSSGGFGADTTCSTGNGTDISGSTGTVCASSRDRSTNHDGNCGSGANPVCSHPCEINISAIFTTAGIGTGYGCGVPSSRSHAVNNANANDRASRTAGESSGAAQTTPPLFRHRS